MTAQNSASPHRFGAPTFRVEANGSISADPWPVDEMLVTPQLLAYGNEGISTTVVILDQRFEPVGWDDEARCILLRRVK